MDFYVVSEGPNYSVAFIALLSLSVAIIIGLFSFGIGYYKRLTDVLLEIQGSLYRLSKQLSTVVKKEDDLY